MDASTWTVVTVCAVVGAFVFAIFFLSLVPPTWRHSMRDELATWPEQWRDLRGDATALVRRGRHAGTPPPPAVVGRAPVYAHEPHCNVLHEGPVECPVQVIRDDSVTAVVTDDGHLVNTVTETIGDIAPCVGPERTDEGATEDWSPAAEVAKVEADEQHAPNVTAAHTAPDLAELTLLADFDAIVDQLRAVPKELVDFGAQVDAGMARAGMDPELHKRWRATAFDVPTGEYRLALTGASA